MRWCRSTTLCLRQENGLCRAVVEQGADGVADRSPAAYGVGSRCGSISLECLLILVAACVVCRAGARLPRALATPTRMPILLPLSAPQVGAQVAAHGGTAAGGAGLDALIPIISTSPLDAPAPCPPAFPPPLPSRGVPAAAAAAHAKLPLAPWEPRSTRTPVLLPAAPPAAGWPKPNSRSWRNWTCERVQK